jgi:hypothetical protein
MQDRLLNSSHPNLFLAGSEEVDHLLIDAQLVIVPAKWGFDRVRDVHGADHDYSLGLKSYQYGLERLSARSNLHCLP